MPAKVKNLTGRRFGRLLALEYTDVRRGKARKKTWKCRCDCGAITYVTTGGLTSGQTRSCGCLRSESVYKRTWKGGKVQHKIRKYIWVYSPEHPNANNFGPGYVYEHHLVMERHLGRYLNKGEIVHHINKDPSDNRIENLKLFSSQGEHLRHHARLRKAEKYIESLTEVHAEV